MKQFFTLILVFAAIYTTSAQISLTLQDDKSQGLAYATSILYSSKDSTMVKGEITNDKGEVIFEGIEAGTYFFKASYIGLADLEIPSITYKGQALNLGTFKLGAASQTLSTVTVTARRPMLEVKADKMILNTDASVSLVGLNGLELLRKAPGVVIDNNENIQLKGKSGVMIYIDGKPSNLNSQDLANLLKGMTSNDIEAVEIITNPSAKYDAQGNAGIINLKLKKNKNFGTNGSLNIGAGYGEYHKANTSLNLNNRNGKWNTFGNISISDNKWWNEMNLYREQNNKIFDQSNIQVNASSPFNTKLGVDYSPSTKHTFGVLASTNGYLRDKNDQMNGKTFISRPGATIQDSVLTSQNSQIGNSARYNANLNYKYADTMGREFTFDIDNGRYSSWEKSNQPNVYGSIDGSKVFSKRIFYTETPSTIKINTLKADYNHEFKKIGWSGSLGMKFADVRSDNQFSFFNEINGSRIKDVTQSNQFDYLEQVFATYLNANGAISKKVNVQLGLRLESTHSIGDLTREPGQQVKAEDKVEKYYTDYFPSAAFTYTFNPKNVLNLNYSRRLDRPNYQELNPFNYRLDELTYRKGNPFLTPQYNNNIELTYTFLQAINFGLSYSKSRDVVSDIIERDPQDANATYINFRNIAQRDNYALSLNTPLPIRPWWNGFLSANLYRTYFKAVFDEYSFDTKTPIATNIYAENNFTLPKNAGVFEISGWYNSASIWGSTFITQPQGSLDLGYKINLNSGLTTLKVGLTDILGTAAWRMRSEGVVNGLSMIGTGAWESRRVNVNVSHRFGNKNVKGERKRKTGLSEEAGRIK